MFFLFKRIVFLLICYFSLITNVLNGKELPTCPSSFITSALCTGSGDIWVATEGGGLLRLPYGTDKWEQQKENGLPETNNFYALVEDRQGRIWVGTDNKSVAVWNGASWKQYNQVNALLGERIFAMAVSPVTGDVAIATSGGLTIYQPQTESWKDYTRAEGLTEDQIASLSFDRKGRLWVAFQTSGVASAEPSNGYSKWNLTQTKWYWDKQQTVRQPFEGKGKGLPSNFCNAICAISDSVWVGTNSGLGFSRNQTGWNFLRGRDYEAKNEGLWKPDGEKSGQATQTNKANRLKREHDQSLLPEDYITCFYPSSKGMWVGFREKGVCLLRIPSLSVQDVTIQSDSDTEKLTSVTCFVALPDGSFYAGTYGKGLLLLDQLQVKKAVGKGQIVKHPSFPVAIPLSELTKEGTTPSNQEETNNQGKALFWYEDWATQGDWCERYGRKYMVLCAAGGPMGSVEDSFGDSESDAYSCVSVKGPHARPGESGVTGKVVWPNELKDGNILYCPISTTRTLAQWSDKGDSVQRNFDGPDLGALVRIPEGRQLLALYFYDPTPLAENELNNSLRDYILEIRKLPSNFKLNTFLDIDDSKDFEDFEEEDFFKEPEYDKLKEYIPFPVLARSRVKSFNGCGVYKNFILEGYGWYYVRILKNYSNSTMINGVFLSSLDETKITVDKLFEKHDGKKHYYGVSVPAPPGLNQEETNKLSSDLLKLWGKSQNMGEQHQEQLFSSRKLGIYAYRHLLGAQAPDDITANWRWRLKIWEKADKEEFREQMKKAWRSLQDTYHNYISSEWAEFAPDTTIPFSREEVRKMFAHKVDWKQYLPDSKIKPELDVEQMKEWLKNKK